jgi:acyl carrier protein
VVLSELGPETDLLSAGIIDSMGLVDLLMFVETEYGYRINLTEADPARFSTVQGLCELALGPTESLRAEAC